MDSSQNKSSTRQAHRRRLPPEERVAQILDAALEQFSQHGFNATRMDDIARACGLSKGGLYVHFGSKDAVFEALLERALTRTNWDELPQLAQGASARAVATWIVDRLHAALLEPQRIAILRLLISERQRVPTRLEQWREGVLRMRAQQVTARIHDDLAASISPDSVLARHPWLALSPVMHTVLWQALFGEGTAPDDDARQAHIDLLCALLE